jgi:serine/threonine protein kinase
VAELGRSADSVVHHVRRHGVDHVLKLLAAEPDPGPILAELRRQALRLAAVEHPGLPLIREVGAVERRPYVVMDLVPGLPLADLLVDGPLVPDAVRSLAVDLAGVLDAVHRHGLVHGRLTPRNVIVDPGGVAHLIDLATPACPSGTQPSQDLVALGRILLLTLTARPPSTVSAAPTASTAVSAPAADDVAQTPPGVPADLAHAVTRLLATDPGEGYPSAAALFADLTRA